MSTPFSAEKHLCYFDEQEWEPLFDEFGTMIPGIRGKSGASEIGADGVAIGIDLIEMQSGSAFPLHTHEGDHILYALSGAGTVTIDGETHRFEAGSSFYISAAIPHNVGAYEGALMPFILLAIGHPQKHVSDHHRMKIVGGF